jgi:hypothetical protein
MSEGSGKAKGKGKAVLPPPPKPSAKQLPKGGGGYLARAAARKEEEAAAAEAAAATEPATPLDSPVDQWLDASPSERFELGDPAAMKHLEEQGYVVIKEVADRHQLERAEELLWEFLGTHAGWKSGEPESWTDEGLQRCSANGIANGIINKRGAGQSELNWYIRTLPRVREVFEHVWDTQDLLTSFDVFGVFRPWHSGKFMKTLGGWFHVDQGPQTQGKQCVQGLLSIFDQDGGTGGLTVIPGSHLRFEELQATASGPEDYIELKEDSPVWQAPHRLVQMRAGDFVLWDSRCVHCNTPAIEQPTAPVDRLLRAVVYVCMTPREKASEKTLEDRRRGYDANITTTHWPHKNCVGFGFKREPPLDYSTAPPEHKALI